MLRHFGGAFGAWRTTTQKVILAFLYTIVWLWKVPPSLRWGTKEGVDTVDLSALRSFREFGVEIEGKKAVSVSVVIVSNHGILVKEVCNMIIAVILLY